MEEPVPGAGRRDVLKNMLVLGAAAPLVGCMFPAATGQRPTAAPRTPVNAGPSSQQLAGQRVIFSYSGLTVPTALLQQITAGQAAGVIFFGGNISSDAQITSVIQQLVQAQRQSPVSSPLLLMTDQEGGLVRRLPGAPTMSEKQIGQSANPAAAASQAGTGAGQNLADVGTNVNLAPVLDVYYKSGNFIDQYQRSNHHRRAGGGGPCLVRQLRAARRARGAGRDGPAAVLGARCHAGPGGHHGPRRRPGQRAAELGRLQRRRPAGDRPPVHPAVTSNATGLATAATR
jgi:hypothetical protein